MSISMILVLIAVLCWFVAALNVPVPRINMTALGLVFFGASILVGRV